MATNQQEIIEQAERILAETGKMPTVEAVRNAVGGGSFSTLNPILREWRQQHQATPAAEDIPARVRNALEQAAGGLWNAFRSEIEERIGAARQQAEERALEAESERDQALEEVTRLETALEDLRTQGEQVREDLATRLEADQESLAVARETMAGLKERVAAQAGEIERTRADLHEAKQETVEAKGQAANLLERFSEAQSAYRQEEANAQRLQQEAETLREQCKAQGQALTTEQEKGRALEVENARLTERAALVDELREQLKALRQIRQLPEPVKSTNDNAQGPDKPARQTRKKAQPTVPNSGA